MKRKVTGLILFIALSIQAISQQSIDNNVDTNAVNALLAKSKELAKSAPEDAINYSTKAKDLSEQLEFWKGKALALKNIGNVYFTQGKHLDAINYWTQSRQVFESINDLAGVSNILNNIGVIHSIQGDYEKALQNYLASLKAAEKSGEKIRILSALNNVGATYALRKETYDKALKYYLMALPLAEEVKDSSGLGTTFVNIGEVYSNKKNSDLALQYFKKSLNIYTAIKDKVNIPYTYNSIAHEYNTQGNYELALQFHKRAFVTAQEVDNKLYMVQSLLGLAKTYIAKGSYGEALYFYKKAEPIGKEINALDELKDVYQGLSTTYAGLKSFPEAYEYQSLLITTKDKLYDISTDKKLANLLFDFELQKKQGEITILQTDNKLRQVEIKQQRFAKNAVTIGLVLVFILAFFIYRNYRIKAKNNIILDNKNAEIEHLLLNIFPSEVANELQKKGQATPRLYDHVSVLFSDFKGFTAIADKLTPEEVVAELNTCFVAFDSIIEKYKLEKIKTIGDSYMCAGGIPAFDKDHVNNMMKASMEMLAFMEQYNTKRTEKGFEVWDIRIGIHVGPVVAGVVGRKKYAYDIWGSTVNIASRMESNGAPGLVNVSAATFELIKDNYECKHRGKVHAKNVGDIDMYFVTGEKVKEVKPENTYILPDMLYN